MAAKRGRRPRTTRRRNFVAIPFEMELALGTLAKDTLLSGVVLTFGEDLFCISIDCLWSIEDPTTSEGPVQVGVSHGDLTDSEVLEALDASLTDPDDIIAKERSRRPVRRVGAFPLAVATAEVLNHGVQVRTPLRFSIGDGHSLDVWALNAGQNANLTTGARVRAAGTLYGRWQR